MERNQHEYKNLIDAIRLIKGTLMQKVIIFLLVFLYHLTFDNRIGVSLKYLRDLIAGVGFG